VLTLETRIGPSSQSDKPGSIRPRLDCCGLGDNNSQILRSEDSSARIRKTSGHRIILRHYLSKPEVKSLAPDGTPCLGTTQGLLRRATINAKKIVPVRKETDRRWEQGEDSSMIDSNIYTYEKLTKMVVADVAEEKTGGYWHPAPEDRIKTQSSADF
jgi:hypothetical protein